MPSPAAPTATLEAEIERTITALWRALSREVPRGLSRTAASVLATLATEGPQRVTALAEREHVAQPSMTVLLQRLERRALVARSEDPTDRRACRVAITGAGAEVLRARAESRARWLHERLDGLSSEERTSVAQALGLLEHLLTEDRENA